MSLLQSACEHLLAAQEQMRRIANLERYLHTPAAAVYVRQRVESRHMVGFAYAMQRKEIVKCARVFAGHLAANEERRPAA